MANLVAVVGAPGTGKSSSMRNLNPSETYVINILGKPLPFKGSASKYNAEKKNWAKVDAWNQIVDLLRGISEHRPEIKTVVLDDIGFLMSIEFFKRAKETGYSKFSEIGQHMFQVVNTAASLRDDLNVVFMFHEEKQIVDGYVPQKKIKTIGRMLDDKFDLAAIFTTVLYTDVTFGKEGEATYSFITNTTSSAPAKSPMEMFKDLHVPNDLVDILQSINEYYE